MDRESAFAPFLKDVRNVAFMGSHRRRMEALLLHFHKAGIPLSVCADSRHLGRKVSTLKPYVRRLRITFPDYVPLCLRPKKEHITDADAA